MDWKKLCDGRYPSYKVEVTAFLDSLEISSSTDVSMQKIYYAIRDDSNVCDDLKSLYREAIFGSEKMVKARIKNRIGNFRRGLKWVEIYN